MKSSIPRDVDLGLVLATSPLLLPFVREFFEIEAHVIALRGSVAAAEAEVEELRAERDALTYRKETP